MPLRITPCVLGYCPVRMVARAGWQNGFCVRQQVKQRAVRGQAIERRRGAERIAVGADRGRLLLIRRHQEHVHRRDLAAFTQGRRSRSMPRAPIRL